MSLEHEEKHLAPLIAICFWTNIVLGMIGELCPNESFWQLFSWQWASLTFMAGCSLFAAKLATDHWHISSAGFILLSIGQGIFYSIQNSSLNHETRMVYAAGILVFLPGMIFICYYSRFPKWLRAFGVVGTLPFLVNMIKIDLNRYDAQRDHIYDVIGFLMMELVGVFWSYYAFQGGGKRKTDEV